jgi:serine/threonine protein kinase
MVRRKVAIKVLPTSHAENRVLLGRFYREARAAGLLNHPNLVKAHDIDRDHGFHFLVMEYVDGVNLQELVTRFGPLSIPRMAHYISQAADGLQYAYKTAGLIHRDIKPANILLDRTGVVRVLDLGLVRFFHDQVDRLTLQYDDKNVLGTADYVAPEQALNSHDVDIRADIYSLGATLYFLLTGRTLFPEGKATQKLIWHQVKQPTPLRQLRPDAPEELAAVVEKMLAKPRDARYQTPGEVIAALAPWTAEPIEPPSEAEMPRLCAAALAGTPPEGDPNAVLPDLPEVPVRSVASRAARLPSRPVLSEGRVPLLNPTQTRRAVPVTEPATPRVQALSAGHDTPHGLPVPAPKAPTVSPAGQPAAPPKPAPNFGDSIWRLATLILASILIGILVRLWIR